MRVAVVGCLHGELDTLYATIEQARQHTHNKVDLVLVTGDFQAIRDHQELKFMAVPHKFRQMGDFYKYITGQAVAPILTIFIGGNHESPAQLLELACGGWVAHNIYFLGVAGVVRVNQWLRIAGISGILSEFDYHKQHFEQQPFDASSMRSAYHIREVDVNRLAILKPCSTTIFMSHDWPSKASAHGDVKKLVEKKPFFRDEVNSNTLGNPKLNAILERVAPDYWFSSHLHVKFPALVPSNNREGHTKFLALDKVVPGRMFVQFLNIGDDYEGEVKLSQDKEWLAIIRASVLTGDDHQSEEFQKALEESFQVLHDKDMTIVDYKDYEIEIFDSECFLQRKFTLKILDILGIDAPWRSCTIPFQVKPNEEELCID